MAKDRVVWTDEEITRFFAAAATPFLAACRLALLTGLRAGELYALKWESVEEACIRVVSHYNHKLRRYLPLTKTGLIRFVPLSEQARMFLAGLPRETEWVLPRMGDFDCGRQSANLQLCAKRLGVPPIRFHDLRALHASKLLRAGISLVHVMQIMGWTQLSTAQRYLRLSGRDVIGLTDAIAFPIDVLDNGSDFDENCVKAIELRDSAP